MTSTRKKALIVYGVVILVVLIAIMFIVPDSFYRKLYDKNIEKVKNQKIIKKEFIEYDIQKERLLKKQFKYEYEILDSLSDKTYHYKCSGNLNGELESGSCTDPERISYTEKTKKKSFKINTDYSDVNYLFNTLLKDVKPEETKYQTTREYLYKTKIKKLDTEIIVYTDLENITKIEISNTYMTYILKFGDISY
jgi:hypothetical protein